MDLEGTGCESVNWINYTLKALINNERTFSGSFKIEEVLEYLIDQWLLKISPQGQTVAVKIQNLFQLLLLARETLTARWQPLYLRRQTMNRVQQMY
jgi:hypothetical protein